MFIFHHFSMPVLFYQQLPPTDTTYKMQNHAINHPTTGSVGKLSIYCWSRAESTDGMYSVKCCR